MNKFIETQIKLRVPVSLAMQHHYTKEKIDEIETVHFFPIDQFISVLRESENVFEVRVKSMPFHEENLDTYKLVSKDSRLKSLIV